MMPGTVGAAVIGQVYFRRHIPDRRVGLDAEDRRSLRVNGKHRPAERRGKEIPQRGAADGSRRFGGADHGDVFRLEEDVERVLVAEQIVRGLTGLFLWGAHRT
jgi:hypothetical protein